VAINYRERSRATRNFLYPDPPESISAIAFLITYRAYVTSPEADRAEGLCGVAARCSAAEPEAPSEAPMHIRAVIGSCAVRFSQMKRSFVPEDKAYLEAVYIP